MADNGNGLRKLSDALKKAAEEKDKALQKYQPPVVTPPPAAPEKEKQQAPQEAPVYKAAEKTESQIRSTGISKKIVAYHNPNSAIAEQFRVVKTHIFSPERAGKFKIVAVTSSTSGEGKTVASINLAVVTAQDSERPVLLIDGNLRKPAIASLLGLNNYKGLGDILSGNMPLDGAINEADIKNLAVLTAGQVSGNPTELLSSQKMKDLLAEVRSKYEYIIIDTPAIIPYADPRILGPMVDGIVIAVRAGNVRREVVARAESVIKSVGANILGYVITGIEYHIPEYIHRHL